MISVYENCPYFRVSASKCVRKSISLLCFLISNFFSFYDHYINSTEGSSLWLSPISDGTSGDESDALVESCL